VDAVPDLDRLKGDIAPGSPLEQLTEARVLVDRLHARGNELLDHFVDAARAGGSSWSEIGSALGTSKQASQQRFGALAEPRPGRHPFGLTGAAAGVLDAAATEARVAGHYYIRPEHIVLGLLSQPDEMAGRLLADCGVTHRRARRQLHKRWRADEPRPTGSLGVAPQTKRLLEVAQTTARTLRHSCPRTEHLLLAAVSPKLQSPAATLLAQCGADPDQVRDLVTRTIIEQDPDMAAGLRAGGRRSRLGLRLR
jgi:hypothetical protein